MTPGRRPFSAALIASLVVLLGGAVGLEVLRDRLYGEPVPARAVMYVKSPEAVKRIALSFSAVLADVYWIRALQYYGGMRLEPPGRKDYSLLYPLLDVTTTLDPMFNIAYRFGAIFLSEPFPGGAGRPDLAVKLLRKGFAHRSDRWQYLQDIGFVYYWWEGDYAEAAAWFEKASGVPGAPWWLKSLAAVTLAQGGDRHSSRILWQALSASADNEWLRKESSRRLQQLDALDQIDQLQAVVRLYASRTGTFPASLEALVRAGYLGGRRSIPLAHPTSSIRRQASCRSAPVPRLRRSRPGSRARCPCVEVPMVLVLAALFGLVIGSFLNVCIYRLPLDQSIVWPASRCTACRRQLEWYENIPVASWMVLRGRCRTCGEHISVMYPIVEAVSAVMFVVLAATFGITPLFVVRVAFGCAMIVLFVIDLQHQILPNEITVPGIVIGLVLSIFLPPGWRESLIGALAGGGVLWLIAFAYERLRGKEGLGFGDVKMLAMIGAFLGWKLMLLTLVFASFTGSFVALLLMLARRADWQSKLPLGTFLALGAVLACVYGDAVVNWYLGFY